MLFIVLINKSVACIIRRNRCKFLTGFRKILQRINVLLIRSDNQSGITETRKIFGIIKSLKTLGSTVERARCRIILATLQSRKQSILSQRGILEFVLGQFFINLLQKFEIVASVVIAVNECIRFFPVTPAILTTWTSFDASVSFLDVPEPQAVKEKTDAAAAITATIRLLMRLLDIYFPFLLV